MTDFPKGIKGNFPRRFSWWDTPVNHDWKAIDTHYRGLVVTELIPTQGNLPSSPTNGQSYIVTSNNVVWTFFSEVDNGSWFSQDVVSFEIFYDIDNSGFYYFDGANYVPFANSSSGLTLIDTWDHSVDGDSSDVVFTNLGNYSEIFIFIQDVTTSASSDLFVRASTDNGSTFYSTSGDYVMWEIDSTFDLNSEYLAVLPPDTGNRYGKVQITNNISGIPTFANGNSSTPFCVLEATTDVVNALQIFASSDLTQGKIYCVGRN